VNKISNYIVIAVLAFTAGIVSATALKPIETAKKLIQVSNAKFDQLGNSTGNHD